MKPTIFEPRLKFKPPLKFFKFGLRLQIIKGLFNRVCVQIYEQMLQGTNGSMLTGTPCNSSLNVIVVFHIFFVTTVQQILIVEVLWSEDWYWKNGLRSQFSICSRFPDSREGELGELNRDCKSMWPFMQRWLCLIHNGTLKVLSDQLWIKYLCF